MDLTRFLTQPATRQALTQGPIAMIFAEDEVEIETTIRHHIKAGFAQVLVFAPDAFEFTLEAGAPVHRISHDRTRGQTWHDAVNQVIAAAPDVWMYYCFNAEYLMFPFCESRSVGEMLAFHLEEKRSAMLTYVIDLYAPDLASAPDGVSLQEAHLDTSGYYSEGRRDPFEEGRYKERQFDFFGGLRWRFEEYIPEQRRRIDRIGLFRAKPGLTLLPDHTFNDEEYNTYACPHHNNLTACIASFRVAKALRRNPVSRAEIGNFNWKNADSFRWSSQQLMDLGLMEPGQWF